MTNQIEWQSGVVDGVLKTCENNLATLSVQTIFWKNTIDKNHSDWDTSSIEMFQIRVEELKRRLDKVSECLDAIQSEEAQAS